MASSHCSLPIVLQACLLMLLGCCATAGAGAEEQQQQQAAAPAVKRIFLFNTTGDEQSRWAHAALNVQRLQRQAAEGNGHFYGPAAAEASHEVPKPDKPYALPQEPGSLTVPLICSGDHLLPNAMIVGVPKAATTTLWGYLVHKVTGGGRVWSYPKEQQFFGRPQDLYSNPTERLHLYRKLFPECSAAQDGKLQYVVDASPDYMLHAESSAAHIAQMYGRDLARQLRFVISLRDPVDQLFSWFNHLGRHSNRVPCNMSFDDWVPHQLDVVRNCLEEADALEDIRRMYLACQGKLADRNWYAAALSAWLSYFSADSVLVLDFAKIKENPRNAVQQVFDHLGLELAAGDLPEEHLNDASTHVDNPCGNQPDMLPSTRADLEEFFAPFNAQLRTLLKQLYPDRPAPEFAERDYQKLVVGQQSSVDERR